MRVTIPCDQCGTILDRPASQVKGTRHQFCNTACMGTYQTEHRTGKNSTRWNGGKRDVPCAQCGAILSRPPNQVNSYAHQFCNRACHAAYQNGGIHDVQCDQCGAPLGRPPSQINASAHQFCNKKCHGAYLEQHATGKNNPLWKGGRVEYYGPSWRRQQRAARKRDNYTCRHCKKKQKNRALDVHHVTPFRLFGYIPNENENHVLANDLTNLLSLCKKCHKQAEHGNIPIQPYLL